MNIREANQIGTALLCAGPIQYGNMVVISLERAIGILKAHIDDPFTLVFETKGDRLLLYVEPLTKEPGTEHKDIPND